MMCVGEGRWTEKKMPNVEGWTTAVFWGPRRAYGSQSGVRQSVSQAVNGFVAVSLPGQAGPAFCKRACCAYQACDERSEVASVK
jgi:hypothetical protein